VYLDKLVQLNRAKGGLIQLRAQPLRQILRIRQRGTHAHDLDAIAMVLIHCGCRVAQLCQHELKQVTPVLVAHLCHAATITGFWA